VKHVALVKLASTVLTANINVQTGVRVESVIKKRDIVNVWEDLAETHVTLVKMGNTASRVS